MMEDIGKVGVFIKKKIKKDVWTQTCSGRSHMKTEAGTPVTVLCASTKTAGTPPEPGEGLEHMFCHAFSGKQPCRRLNLPPRPVCARCYSSPRALIPQQDKAEGHGADDTFHEMQQHSHNSDRASGGGF